LIRSVHAQTQDEGEEVHPEENLEHPGDTCPDSLDPEVVEVWVSCQEQVGGDQNSANTENWEKKNYLKFTKMGKTVEIHSLKFYLLKLKKINVTNHILSWDLLSVLYLMCKYIGMDTLAPVIW